MDHQDRPISIAMVALGGQGGGVLTGWLVETAEKNGYIAQSTYVAGVAQRTGSTVYCVEMFPRKEADKTGVDTVMEKAISGEPTALSEIEQELFKKTQKVEPTRKPQRGWNPDWKELEA